MVDYWEKIAPYYDIGHEEEDIMDEIKFLENAFTPASSAWDRLRLPVNTMPLIFFEPITVPAPVLPAERQ